MKKISYFIIILTFTYLFLNLIIGNDNLNIVKKYIPNYYNWKNIVKDVFFPHKNKNILIKTDGSESFNLSKENKIYIYSDIDRNSKLIIRGDLKNKNVVCLEKEFNQRAVEACSASGSFKILKKKLAVFRRRVF